MIPDIAKDVMYGIRPLAMIRNASTARIDQRNRVCVNDYSR